MKITLFRRGRALQLGFVAVLAAGLALTGCSTGSVADAGQTSSNSSSTAYPLTIKNTFGETVIPKQPQRIATVSWVNDDVVMALGVVPVGMPTVTWGGDDKGLTPWKQDALNKLGAPLGSAKAPVLYPELQSQINFTEIAKTSPDLIIAAYSGLSKEDYEKLSKIAPVVSFPDKPYGTSWQDSTTLIGKALGKDTEAKDLIAKTDKSIKDKTAQYPQLAGKTFIAGNIETGNAASINIYTPQDNRPRLMTSLGLKLAPVVEKATKDSNDFFFDWSAEKANELASDVFVTWVPDGGSKESMVSDPLIGQIPAIKSGGLVASSDKSLSLAISAASPLSVPWALDRFVPEVAAAVDASAKK